MGGMMEGHLVRTTANLRNVSILRSLGWNRNTLRHHIRTNKWADLLRALCDLWCRGHAKAPATPPAAPRQGATARVWVALFTLLAVAAATADDTARLRRLLAGDVVTIPPGDYCVGEGEPIPIRSGLTVFAYGARFHLPKRLGDQARVVVFTGTNITKFTWHGGEFFGNVFDPARRENPWEPNANTRIFVIATTPGGRTSDILFRDVRSDGICGAVIHVNGAPKEGSHSEVETFAERVVVENCTLLRSGKFMWDYGYLWQMIVWPEDYEPWEVERAYRYFRSDFIRDEIRFDKLKDPICFFGGPMPAKIVRGRQYYIVGPNAISDRRDGTPIPLDRTKLSGVKLIQKLNFAFNGLYAPTGCGPGKGAVDLQCCRDVRITGCQLSALGDTMHVQRCHNVVFANNQVLGSRMGAFFLAEYCKNATVAGNLVDGTNGSRVMSVERSCEDVTIIGNTFRNGGRGSWINQPKNFILQGNIFVNNTTKGERDPRRGRRSYLTGDYEPWPELYFTVYQTNATYGPVIVRDNIFVLADSCATNAVSFAPGGHDIQMTGNIFQGRTAVIMVSNNCTNVEIRDNPGASLVQLP